MQLSWGQLWRLLMRGISLGLESHFTSRGDSQTPRKFDSQVLEATNSDEQMRVVEDP